MTRRWTGVGGVVVVVLATLTLAVRTPARLRSASTAATVPAAKTATTAPPAASRSTTTTAKSKATTAKSKAITAKSKATAKAGAITTATNAASTLIPAYTGAKKMGFCVSATEAKAKFEDLHARKRSLGVRAPAAIFTEELALQAALAKLSPKEFGADFAALKGYTTLFSELAATKDVNAIAKLSARLSDDKLLSDYLDAVIHIEGFMRRTCGFPVGI